MTMTIPDRPRARRRNVADALDDAADVLETSGWTQGRIEDDATGAVCAWGALRKVTREHTPLQRNAMIQFAATIDPHWDERVRKSYHGRHGLPPVPIARGRIVRFNDSRRRNGQAQVVQAMRRAANRWRKAHGIPEVTR